MRGPIQNDKLRRYFSLPEKQVDYVVGERITLFPSTYVKEVLDRFKMTECKPASIPMDLGVANSLLPYNRNADKETIK